MSRSIAHVLEAQLGRLLGPGWTASLRTLQGPGWRAAWYELLPTGPHADGRWLFVLQAHPGRPAERASLVAQLSRQEERLEPYAAGPLGVLVACAPEQAEGQALLRRLRAGLSLVDLGRAERDRLQEEVTRARAALREAELAGQADETAPRAPAAPPLPIEPARLEAALRARLDLSWTVEREREGWLSVSLTGYTDERGRTTGVWVVLDVDPREPAGARAVLHFRCASAAPFQLLGWSPRCCVMTWTDRQGAPSRAVAEVLELTPPDARLLESVDPEREARRRR
jgi:hypothetical protein